MPSTDSSDSRTVFDRPLVCFLDHPDLPFADALTSEHVVQTAKRHGVSFGTAANSIFTPMLTLWAWLGQVVFSDKSCVAACARVGVLLAALGRPNWSQDTGVYCRARRRLPAPFIQELAEGLADRLEEAALAEDLWHGLHVKLADGTTLSLPDTPENQAAFPQPSSQQQGLGFPMIRMVAVISWATGLLSALAYASYEGKGTGETALLRQLLHRFKPGDLAVLDRYYGNYWMVALLLAIGVHLCVRVNHARKVDFSRGKRLGPRDHIITWKRPPRPGWMSQEMYVQLPEELSLREVGIEVARPGDRTEQIVVVTDLLDSQAYPKEDIAELYRWRWQVEVELRHFKGTLKMRELSCKTPENVQRELWAGVLGFNLTKKVMLQATRYRRTSKRPSRARRGGCSGRLTVRHISFKRTLQQLEKNYQGLLKAPAEQYKQMAEEILTTLASKPVGQRPGRSEPRAVKRRPKNQPMLTTPRAEAKKRMQEGKTGKDSGVSGRRRR
jgi:hypothetical protein